MTDTRAACVICKTQETTICTDVRTNIRHCICRNCGEFRICYEDVVNLSSPRNQLPLHRISSLVRERFIRTGQAPLLCFPDENYSAVPTGIIQFDIGDALQSWPDSVPERLDRILVNLGRTDPSPGARLQAPINDLALWFAETVDESRFVFQALKDSDWIHTPNLQTIQVSPAGWQRFDELKRGGSDDRNPVFVAMWFGRDRDDDADRTSEMKRLYDEGIAPAVRAVGFKVKRSDSEPHNQHIMNQILADIRRSPFIVADLTHHTNGVYYEAGFAAGLHIEVVHCCPEKESRSVHFDLRQMSQVRYADAADLRKKLQAHIGATVGSGPYRAERAATDD